MGKILFFLLAVYIGIALYLYFTQDSKVFKYYLAKEYIPKNAKPIDFVTSDGAVLKGAEFIKDKNLPYCLYFGGNANNSIEFVDKTAPLLNCNCITFNYPGYAGSSGKPSEDKILKYAKEIYDKYKPKYIIGRSLGSAVASYVAKDNNILILITPFDSIENIAKSRYPFLPISLLLKHKFNEAQYLSAKKVPVFVIALKNDDVIPSFSLQNLINSIQNLKKLYLLDGVTHADIYSHPEVIKILKKICEK
ncbi:MAG: alpha/beta hydrolase [Epsilonproteobacteria bacterium]|nr:alpha/beta hydrolase [Campylobacterota bacterium]